MADRYFGPAPDGLGRVVLDPDEARHLARSARRTVGDEVEVFDGRGGGWRARVEAIDRDRVTLLALEPIDDRAVPSPIALAVAAPKGDRLDWLVEKCTEIGVGRLTIVLSERSVVDPRGSKLDRLRRTILEASKQSGRNRLMTLDGPTPLATVLSRDPEATRLIAHSGGVPASRWPGPAPGVPAVLAIGPEGGWTEAERDLADRLGWVRVGLGPTRLRVETAALVGAAAWMARTGGRTT